VVNITPLFQQKITNNTNLSAQSGAKRRSGDATSCVSKKREKFFCEFLSIGIFSMWDERKKKKNKTKKHKKTKKNKKKQKKLGMGNRWWRERSSLVPSEHGVGPTSGYVLHQTEGMRVAKWTQRTARTSHDPWVDGNISVDVPSPPTSTKTFIGLHPPTSSILWWRPLRAGCIACASVLSDQYALGVVHALPYSCLSSRFQPPERAWTWALHLSNDKGLQWLANEAGTKVLLIVAPYSDSDPVLILSLIRILILSFIWSLYVIWLNASIDSIKGEGGTGQW